jgi:hypothetical protein
MQDRLLRKAGTQEVELKVQILIPAFMGSSEIQFPSTNKKTMRGESHGQASLPSAALPASGSRGSTGVFAPIISARRLPRTFASE